ncbi:MULTISPECIES: helix-turn-helix transcriptional regulator [unclassified Inquilinus]|uniref:helix-turn-helix transcriptional regulator n=1 Tax=unclassified Inquilinus TaxID=2645927 RepID=UPI003F933595
MDRADAILEAVQRTYDAAVSPDAWPSALEAITDTARGLRGFLVVENRLQQRVELCLLARHDPVHVERFAAAAEAGMLPSWISGIGVGRAVRSSAMQTDRDYARSDFYNEVVRRNGCYHGAVAQVSDTPTHRGVLSLCRARGWDDYGDEDVAALQVVLPHLTRALQLRERIGDADLRAADAEAVLDRLDAGVILADAGARPIRLNRRAEAIIAQTDGLSSGLAGLAAALPEETRRLQHAIALAAAVGAAVAGLDAASRVASAGTRMQVSRPSGRCPLLVTVIPIRGAVAEGRRRPAPQVAIFVTDPDRVDVPAAASLQERFGLTAAEAAFAVEIGCGDGLQAVAERLSIARSTARTHLARIFDKTGTSRQAELVRLLMRCDQPMLRDG